MYSQHMNRLFRVNRSPEAGESNGGAGASGEAAAGAAGAGSQAGSGAGAAAAPEYLSKSDFDTFRSELTQQFARLTPREQAREDAKEGKQGDPTKPDVSKYNFQNPADLDRYNLDNYRYHRHLDRAQETKDGEAKQAEEKSKSDRRGHQSRVTEYTKENPSFTTDLKAAQGKINVLKEVENAVYGSKNSHLALHYMAKNPGADNELNMIAESDGIEAVRERIGEMAADMRAEQKASHANTTAAGQKPVRFNTRGAANGGARKATAAERFERFNS